MDFDKQAIPSAVPNSLAPEAWLSPDEAEKSRVFEYVAVGCLVVAVWDIVTSLPEEIRLLMACTRNFAFRLSMYMLSRLASLSFVLVIVLSSNLEIKDCEIWGHFATTLFILTHAATSLLFYFRVSAVYHNQAYANVFFGIAWLVAIAGALPVPFTIESRHIEPTLYCKLDLIEPFACIHAFTQGGYDLLVCAAVTHKLGCSNDVDTPRNWSSWFSYCKSAFSVNLLASRFLQDSHIYFAVTALLKVLEIIFFYSLRAAGRGSSMQIIVAFPDTVLVSIMATRVFRKMKLGQPGLWSNIHSRIDSTVRGVSTTSVRFQRPGVVLPLHPIGRVQKDGGSYKHSRIDSTASLKNTPQ